MLRNETGDPNMIKPVDITLTASPCGVTPVAATEQPEGAGGVAPLGAIFVQQYEKDTDIRIIARKQAGATTNYQPSSESGNPLTARRRHRKALDVRPPVAAYCFDGRSSIPAHLSTAEAAAILGVSAQSIRRLVCRRRLQALARGAFRISAASVLAYREGRA
jgi:excisionase family DNA binding protein